MLLTIQTIKQPWKNGTVLNDDDDDYDGNLMKLKRKKNEREKMLENQYIFLCLSDFRI